MNLWLLKKRNCLKWSPLTVRQQIEPYANASSKTVFVQY